MNREIALVVLASLAACTRQASAVYPIEMAIHAKELVDEGEATVVGTKAEEVRLDADAQVDVTIVDGDTQTPGRFSIRELVAGCITSTDAPSCMAAKKLPPQPIAVRSKLKFDTSRVSTIATFGVMGGALGVCLATCQGSSELSRDLAYGGAAALGVVGLLVLLLMIGGG